MPLNKLTTWVNVLVKLHAPDGLKKSPDRKFHLWSVSFSGIDPSHDLWLDHARRLSFVVEKTWPRLPCQVDPYKKIFIHTM